MSTNALCPECGIPLGGTTKRDELFVCSNCDLELKVISVNPLKLGRLNQDKLDIQDETPERRKLPAYLKSVPQPIIPEPSAPFGRNDEGAALVPMRSDIEILRDVLTPSSGAAGNVEPKSYTPRVPFVLPRAPKTTAAEDQFNRQMAQFKRVDTSTFNLNYFGILGITRETLVGLLDSVVGVEPSATRKRVPKSRSPIEKEIRELEYCEQRVEELKTAIKGSKKFIENCSAHHQKIEVKRGERNPEDIWDDETRRRYKREEAALIKQYEHELKQLRARLKQSDIDSLRKRLLNWGKSESDYETMAVSVDAPVTFKQKFVSPRHFDVYEIEQEYEQLLGNSWRERWNFDDGSPLDIYEALASSNNLTKSWKAFEDELILQLVGYGLIPVTMETLKKYPKLGRNLKEIPSIDDDSEVDDSAERELISKTGGAHIGGGIYGEGTQSGEGQPTGLKTFEKYDKHRRRGRLADAADYGTPADDIDRDYDGGGWHADVEMGNQ